MNMPYIQIADWSSYDLMIRANVFKDKSGKYYVEVNGVVTQKELDSDEIVRYLCNALEGK